MNLLIVDDEILAIQGLVDDIPWQELHFDEIYTAGSYAQAVKIFREHTVDVLLCDIEMPMLGGMELVSWVKENYPATECIFLTCHDEFAFAREAVRLQCLGYILKPVDTDEVVEYLKKAEEKIGIDVENQRYKDYGKRYLKHLTEDVRGAGNGEILTKTENYICSNLQEDLSLEELAAQVGVSATHLGRLFKKKNGCTIMDYVIQKRLELAKELLKDPELSVSAIAFKTGYNNYSYFTKSFKKFTGMTPREYRRTL